MKLKNVKSNIFIITRNLTKRFLNLIVVLLITIGYSQTNCSETPPMDLPVLNPTELTSGGYDDDANPNDVASPLMRSVAVNSNGIIATTGIYVRYDTTNFKNLMFQNSDFSANTTHLPMSIATQGNGLVKIVALQDGSFVYYDLTARNFYQVTSNGTRTEVMSPFSPAYAPKMYVSKLGNYIYVAEPWGDVKKFTFPGGVEDTSFNYSGPANRNLYDVVEQSDGKVIVGIALEGPQRFNTDGSIDNTWTNIETGGAEALLALAVQSDDKVLVSGTQININVGGVTHRGLIRLNANGTHDTSFTRQSFSGLSGTTINETGAPYDIEVNASDEIYIAGDIRSNTDENDTEMIPLLAKLDANGNMDLEFRNNVFAMSSNSIYGIKLQCDGKLLVMSRQGLSNLYHGGLVRLHANGVIDTEINNTPNNVAANLGLPENNAKVIAVSTKQNPAVPSVEGLEVFYRMAGNSHYNSMVFYDFAKESSFNVTGFLPDPSGVYDEPDNTDLTFEDFRRVSDSNIIFAHSRGRISSIDADGNRRWIIDTGSENRISYADLSPDKTTLAFSSVTENNLYFLNTDTGSFTTPINVGIDGDIMYTPSGNYIFIKGRDSTPLLKRFDTDGTNVTSIIMDAYPIGGGATSPNFDEIYFYSDTDFYIYSSVENYNRDYLYKYKLTNAAGNPDPNGTFAKLDTAFGDNGAIDLGNPYHPGTSSGLRNQWTVDKYGNVYVGGRRHWSGTDLMGANISRIGPVGVDVDPLYIRVGNVTGSIAIDLLFDIRGKGLPILNNTFAINDFNNTFADTMVTGNVLTNDEDLEGDTQTVNPVPVTAPTNGTVVINADGTYTYTPTAGFVGTDTFEYEVCDNGLPQACDTAIVTMEVMAIPTPNTNDKPIANNDTATTEVDTPVSGNALPNDFDPDGDILTVNTTPITTPTNGTVVINPNGTYTYTPNPGFEGTDSFVYEVCDNGSPSLCDTATVTIDVLPAGNGANITYANDDAVNGNQNTTLTGNVLDNDTDPEGDIQTVNTIPVTPPTNGTVVLNSDGTFVYTPTTDFSGTDSFVYEVCDNVVPSACDTATVYISVNSTNDTFAVNDFNNTFVDTSVTGNVLSNDEDTQGDTLTVNTTPVTAPTNGTVVLNADGTYTYTPNGGYVGTDTFEYEVCDNGTPVACDTAIVTIEVIVPNICTTPDFSKLTPEILGIFVPVLNFSVTDYDVSSGFGLPAGSVLVTCSSVDVREKYGLLRFSLRGDGDNDAFWTIKYNTPKYLKAQHGGALQEYKSDIFKVNDGMPYTFTSNLLPGLTHSVSADTYTVTNNTAVKIFDSSFIWESNNSSTQFDFEFHTTAPSIATSGSDYAVFIDICMPLNATLAINDFNNTFVDTAVSGNVLTNDEDAQGDTQTVNTTPVLNPTNGTVVLNTDGTYTYTPIAGFVGTDTFEYTVCDNGIPQACDTAIVTVKVLAIPLPTNNKPIANEDTSITEVNIPVSGNVLPNDIDQDGDALTVNTIPTSTPINGTVVINPDGTFTYTPNDGFEGTDSFVYEVCDNGTPSLCDTATVTIEVLPVNITNETFANDDAVNGNQNTTLSGNVLDNDTDPEGDIQTVNTIPVTSPTNGTLTLNEDGTFDYVPNTDFSGTDSFVYQVCDNGGPIACDTATVYITVNLIVPDYKVIILTGSTVVVSGTTADVDYRVLISEINGAQNIIGANNIEVRISKVEYMDITFDSTITDFPISNADWLFEDTPYYYKLTYIANNGVFNANAFSMFLVNAVCSPPDGSSGNIPINVGIKHFSGGELNNDNNEDYEYIQIKK